MDRIITLDIEASGLAPNSYPIEVGVTLKDGSSWCSLIKPESHWQHWCKQAEKIHQISQDNIHNHGKSVVEIAKHLNQLLKDKTVYSDCWVLDDKWLRQLYMEAKLTPTFRLRDIVYLLKEGDFAYWEETKNTVAKELNIDRHRATTDARILQESFLRIKALHYQNNHAIDSNTYKHA